MAEFLISIPDELTPGIVATAFAEDKMPEEVVSDYAEALARKTCQDLKVGPFYVGPVQPRFNADGTPNIIEVEQ
jgi:hypothetical protein